MHELTLNTYLLPLVQVLFRHRGQTAPDHHVVPLGVGYLLSLLILVGVGCGEREGCLLLFPEGLHLRILSEVADELHRIPETFHDFLILVNRLEQRVHRPVNKTKVGLPDSGCPILGNGKSRNRTGCFHPVIAANVSA